MDPNMKHYYDYTISPLGNLFYKTVWAQLGNITGKKILDFGSAFASTARHYAKNNELTAIEHDQSIIDAVKKLYNFTLLQGDINTLRAMPSCSYDVIFCHLVFEFVDNPKEILQELIRLLKDDGFLSIVRHHRNGRIIQTVLQEYDLEACKKLLEGEPAYSSAFGDIKYYENNDLIDWSEHALSIEKIFGVRALASLHSAELQKSEGWEQKMFEVEWELLKRQEFVDIAYFNHLILKKIKD